MSCTCLIIRIFLGEQGCDGAALCLQDPEGGGSVDGAPQPDLPGWAGGGPHQTHHEARATCKLRTPLATARGKII